MTYVILGESALIAILFFYAEWQGAKAKAYGQQVSQLGLQLAQAHIDGEDQKARYEKLLANMRKEIEDLERNYDALPDDVLRARLGSLFTPKA